MSTALFLLKRREDYSNNPALVVIEGLWVTPAKFQELMGLARHAGRAWMVRIHSDMPFLSSEGVAMDWIAQYLALGVLVAPNSPRMHDQLLKYAAGIGYDEVQRAALIPYLPNTYPVDFRPLSSVELDTSAKTMIDVACFGAYRPLKNHLQQAHVAVEFANRMGKTLRFHVNDRQDGGGNGPFRNVQDMFANLPIDSYELVLHPWEDRETFLGSLQNVDMLMQLSFNETFNIVAADAVWVGRPVFGSAEIPWIYPLTGDPTNQRKAVQNMELVWGNKPFFINQNRTRLRSYNTKSETLWVRYVSPYQA